MLLGIVCVVNVVVVVVGLCVGADVVLVAADTADKLDVVNHMTRDGTNASGNYTMRRDTYTNP